MDATLDTGPDTQRAATPNAGRNPAREAGPRTGPDSGPHPRRETGLPAGPGTGSDSSGETDAGPDAVRSSGPQTRPRADFHPGPKAVPHTGADAEPREAGPHALLGAGAQAVAHAGAELGDGLDGGFGSGVEDGFSGVGVLAEGASGGGAGYQRPSVTELRLAAFGVHRSAVFRLEPVTLFTGPSGSGKSHVLAAYAALSKLASGATLTEAFPDPRGRVPERAVPDAERRRGFRIGCTVDGPVGPVRLDLAVQAEPDLRLVGERLTLNGQILLTTALRDPGRRSVQAAWLTGGSTGMTRAPLPDDRLGTALLPLRVAGATAGQRRVLAAAEQVVVALRAVFPCDPRPDRMRSPVRPGPGRLRVDCANLADVLRRTRHECGTRHALLAEAARTGCAGPVAGLDVRPHPDGSVTALLDRGPTAPATEFGRLGAGELRFIALALVLLTGPGVLAVDPAAELLSAQQALTVLADGFDHGQDGRQRAELLRLALLSCARGHIRLVGAIGEDTAGTARALPGVSVVDLGP